MSLNLVNPYMKFAAGIDTTWEQLENDTTVSSFETNDDFCFAILVDSSVVDEGDVTTVQWRFAGAGASGTVNCCVWTDLTTMTDAAVGGSAAALLAVASHTYWSKAATGLSDAFYGDGNTTTGDPLVAGNIIGVVITGSGGDNTPIRFESGVLSGYTTYKIRAADGDPYGNTATFSISTSD